MLTISVLKLLVSVSSTGSESLLSVPEQKNKTAALYSWVIDEYLQLEQVLGTVGRLLQLLGCRLRTASQSQQIAGRTHVDRPESRVQVKDWIPH